MDHNQNSNLQTMRPLANFNVQKGIFSEALVDHLRTTEEQEETIRQYVAKIVAVAGSNVDTTILMHMIDTVSHVALIINNGSKEVITINAKGQYPDSAIIHLYQDFTATIPPTTQEQNRPVISRPDKRTS